MIPIQPSKAGLIDKEFHLLQFPKQQPTRLPEPSPLKKCADPESKGLDGGIRGLSTAGRGGLAMVVREVARG